MSYLCIAISFLASVYAAYQTGRTHALKNDFEPILDRLMKLLEKEVKP